MIIGDQRWFDSLCQKGRVISVTSESGSLSTVVEEKKFLNLKRAGLPFLTPYTNLQFNCKESKKFDLFRMLLRKLKAEYSYVKLPIIDNIDLASVAKWEGWDTSLKYSYRVAGLQELSCDDLLQKFNGKMRGKIRKAERTVEICTDIDLDRFIAINELTFRRQNIKVPYPSAVLHRHIKELYKNKIGFTLGAIDDDQNIHSVGLVTIQGDTAYLHVAGDDPKLRMSGSAIYLILCAMKICKDNYGIDVFDFEGSSIEPVEMVRRNCGGEKYHYFEVSWRTRPLRMFI